jgi:hypothetical membrane protein
VLNRDRFRSAVAIPVSLRGLYRDGVGRVARWALLSAAAAPVLLIGGWTLAAARQPAGFDPLTATISALAAYDATDRWVMTSAFAGLGVCHVTTALGLRPAALPGRAVLAAGGVATVLVAVFPLPAVGESTLHTVAAATAFGALAVWPALAWRRGSGVAGWGLRPVVSMVAATVLLALVGWFVIELGSGERVGLAERVAAGAQALWPLAVTITAYRSGARETGG